MENVNEDKLIIASFLANFRDDSVPVGEKPSKYMQRLCSIKNGTSRVLLIELDDLAMFSNSEARHRRI